MTDLIYLYKLLSLGLSYPEHRTWELLRNMLAESRQFLSGPMLQMAEGLGEHVAGDVEVMESEYLATFDLAVKVSPYETEYLNERISRKPFELADIAGFYRAFSVSLDEERSNRESIDHIAVELEFMAILTMKEAEANAAGEKDREDIVRDAKMKFLRDHLARWGFTFCSQVRQYVGHLYYLKLAGLIEALLLIECERHHLDPSVFGEMVRDSYSGIRAEDVTCGQ